MPKKPLTSFICFYRENKIKMRNKLQEVTRCYRVAQMMAEKWKSLSKSEK